LILIFHNANFNTATSTLEQPFKKIYKPGCGYAIIVSKNGWFPNDGQQSYRYDDDSTKVSGYGMVLEKF
jgi:hypothetical protein